MIKAILFDQDGVIIDSERNGHRLAFEKAFRQFGYDIQWDPDLYHKLLQVGGGKERIQHYFENVYTGSKRPDNLDRFVQEIHAVKTTAFIDMLEEIPLRPGIRRFMKEGNELGIPLGICTTSNERVASTVADKILHDVQFEFVLAGDMVTTKKPNPEIYLKALDILKVKPSEALVLEDSNIGVRAAKAAGCNVLATYNEYTKHEDLSLADAIVSSLGESGEPAVFSTPAIALEQPGIIHVKDLLKVF